MRTSPTTAPGPRPELVSGSPAGQPTSRALSFACRRSPLSAPSSGAAAGIATFAADQAHTEGQLASMLAALSTALRSSQRAGAGGRHGPKVRVERTRRPRTQSRRREEGASAFDARRLAATGELANASELGDGFAVLRAAGRLLRANELVDRRDVDPHVFADAFARGAGPQLLETAIEAARSEDDVELACLVARFQISFVASSRGSNGSGTSEGCGASILIWASSSRKAPASRLRLSTSEAGVMSTSSVRRCAPRVTAAMPPMST